VHGLDQRVRVLAADWSRVDETGKAKIACESLRARQFLWRILALDSFSDGDMIYHRCDSCAWLKGENATGRLSTFISQRYVDCTSEQRRFDRLEGLPSRWRRGAPNSVSI
jgi:hypothetical protein